MSSNGRRVELKLNLSPPVQRVESPKGSVSSSCEMSGTEENSCVSSEPEQEEQQEVTCSMVLAGCPRCMMYVMLSHVDPKCPKCKSSVLLDFLAENNQHNTTNNANHNNFNR